jgi:hypothetical protein
MKRNTLALLLRVVALSALFPCDAKSDAVTRGREAVKEVTRQPFGTLKSAKDSLSDDKTKTAIEQWDKETEQP